MLRRLRERGPVVLVPLAWTFVAAAHLDVVSSRTLLIAHLVMTALLVAFAALSWHEMRSGVLLAWRRIVTVGVVPAAAGAAGLAATPPVRPLLWVAVVGWMLLPAAGLWYTGGRAVRFPGVYRAGGALSALGAVVYVLGGALGPVATVGGLVVVGVGQTAGIVAAVVAD